MSANEFWMVQTATEDGEAETLYCDRAKATADFEESYRRLCEPDTNPSANVQRRDDGTAFFTDGCHDATGRLAKLTLADAPPPQPASVYVATYSDRRGEDVRVFASRAHANKWRDEIVTEEWNTMRHGLRVADPEAAAVAYFGRESECGDEFWSVAEVEVEGASPAPAEHPLEQHHERLRVFVDTIAGLRMTGDNIDTENGRGPTPHEHEDSDDAFELIDNLIRAARAYSKVRPAGLVEG